QRGSGKRGGSSQKSAPRFKEGRRMSTTRIYITRPLREAAMRMLEGHVEFRMWKREGEPVKRDTLLREIVDVDGIICLITEKMDAEVIDRPHRCRGLAQGAA